MQEEKILDTEAIESEITEESIAPIEYTDGEEKGGEENTDEPSEAKGDEPPADSEYCDSLIDDLDALVCEFPELSGIDSISKIDGAMRYGELRELGLSPREAYLATRPKEVRVPNTKSHLTPAAPSGARHTVRTIPHRELRIARELFEGLSDAEIEALYKRVNKA